MRETRCLLLLLFALLPAWPQQTGPSLPGLPDVKVMPGTPAADKRQPGQTQADGAVDTEEVLSVRDGEDLLETGARFVTGTYRVIAPTTVADASGQLITNLRPDEFVLYDNGVKQNISVDVTFQPISLVVAVQASAATESVLPEIRKIGSMLQPLITGDDGEVAVISFDHRVQVKQEFTRDGLAVEQAMQNIKAGSSTSAFVDAVMQATRMLRNRPKGNRRVLLMIAENRDKGSETRTKYALTEVELHNIEVYTININRFRTKMGQEAPIPRPDPVPVEARGPMGPVPVTPTTMAQYRPGVGSAINFVPLVEEIFRQAKSIFIDNHAELFTRYTGGREFGYMNQRELEKAISQLGEHLHSQYLISYQPSNREEGGWHEITVEVRRADLEVFNRRGYWTASFYDGQPSDAEAPSQELKEQQKKERKRSDGDRKRK